MWLINELWLFNVEWYNTDAAWFLKIFSLEEGSFS